MRRLALLTAAVALLLAPAAAPAHHGHPRSPFPKLIALPDGWQPEGIAIKGSTFYVGSIPTGAVIAATCAPGRALRSCPRTRGVPPSA